MQTDEEALLYNRLANKMINRKSKIHSIKSPFNDTKRNKKNPITMRQTDYTTKKIRVNRKGTKSKKSKIALLVTQTKRALIEHIRI